MRNVVAYELCTLDGVAEDPTAFITDFDEVMHENLARVISTQDAVVLGRRTYTDWVDFWPTSDIEPFATFINGVQKYVATSSPLDPGWHHVTAIDGSLTAFVTELKSQPGGDIGVHGSIEVAQSLLRAGLVDELRLVIAPAVHLHGRKLFDNGLQKRLTPTRSLMSPTGYLLIDYTVTS